MASVDVRYVRKSSALRARGPAKLQATRSMPLDYRHAPPKPAAPATNGVGRRAADVEEDEAVAPAERDADSPYSSAAATAEDEESAAEGGGEADSASSAPPAAPAGPSSQRDTRWGDTSSLRR